MKARLFINSAMVALPFVMASAAHAQGQAGQLEEVIVTARRVEESAQARRSETGWSRV